MNFTTFTIVASFLALVVAHPGISSIDNAEVRRTACMGQWCFNTQSTESNPCACGGSLCQALARLGGDDWYCT